MMQRGYSIYQNVEFIARIKKLPRLNILCISSEKLCYTENTYSMTLHYIT